MTGFNVINFIKLFFFFLILVSASDTLLDVDDARGNVGVHRCVFRVFNYFQWRDMVSAKNSPSLFEPGIPEFNLFTVRWCFKDG